MAFDYGTITGWKIKIIQRRKKEVSNDYVMSRCIVQLNKQVVIACYGSVLDIYLCLKYAQLVVCDLI